MGCAELKISKLMKPWDIVIELGENLPEGSWMLIGGLMTQAHAMIAGYQSRSTVDVDVLVDAMASTSNISAVVRQLGNMGFALKEPGLRGTAFHRMTRGALVADICQGEPVADDGDRRRRAGDRAGHGSCARA